MANFSEAFSRVADQATLEMQNEMLDPKAMKKLLSQAERLIPPSIWQRLRKSFTPKGLPFFRFYIEMNKIRLGGPVEGNLKSMYKRAADRLAQVRSPYDGKSLSPAAVNQIALTRPEVNRTIARIQQDRMTPIYWGQFNAVFVPLLVEISKDKGVFIKPTRQQGRERWATFRKLSPKQERIEKLRDDDPESYALMKTLGQTMAEIDAGIEARIIADGQTLEKGFLAGRPVLIGVDPDTKEEMVYDRDGEVVTKAEFFKKVRDRAEAMKKLARVPTRTQVPPTELRVLDDERLAKLTGDVEWDSITDDLAKQGRLTRLFPTKRVRRFIQDPETGTSSVEEVKVIVEGRYKGVFLDDMINSEGRLIEGTAYTYDKSIGREAKIPPRRLDIAEEREPYVSVAEVIEQRTFQGKRIKVKKKKLYLKIGGSNPNAVLRNAIKKLACNTGTKRGCIPSISYERAGTGNAAGFYFDPKDFGIIMQSLQGMSLSSAALAEVKTYYKELAEAEEATQNLDAYEPEALGSASETGERFAFIQGSRDQNGNYKPFELREKQKQALAWMDANGNNGVCALETGVGKTATSIGMMMKLVRDGLADEDSTYTKPDGTVVQTNGRFLFVCPTSLRGNIKKEVKKILSDPKVMLDKLDVLTYAQFRGASRSGKVPRGLRAVPFWKSRLGRGKRAAKAWDASLYAAIFFDEAQAMKDPSTKTAQAALKLYHPRKVCLTASPMERNPMEAYVLAAITNNTPLFGRSLEARNNRKEMRRFKERFCEIVGGRIVGVKNDPTTQRDLHTWVKRNIFHADKTEVKEYNLPDPVITTTPVIMPPEVEGLYRDITSQFAKIMEGAAKKFGREAVGSYEAKQAERVFSRALAPIMRLLTKMANRPQEALEDIAYAVENGNLPGNVNKDGEPRELPKGFISALKKWQSQYTADDLRGMSQQMGNPKLQAAADFLAAKLERAKGSRSLIFADDKKLCMEAGDYLAKTLSGTHVVALSGSIHFFRGGNELSEWVFPLDKGLLSRLVKDPEEIDRILQETGGVSRHSLPFTKRSLKLHPAIPGKAGVHDVYLADDWQQFVLKEIVNPNPSIKTATLLGSTYMYGHNLQSFNTVIHLDRNAWKSESMKQRTARAWRAGQSQVVDEVTLDMAYAPDIEGQERSESDQTLDQIRASFQAMDAAIFDDIIKAAQKINLGEEWQEVDKKDASLWRLDQKVLDMLTSPYMGRVKSPREA